MIFSPLMATEIDTLSKALSSTTGGFSDTLRCMFEHETISKLRKNQEELIEIPDPHFSVLISGTFNQLKPLIKSRENGLMSRFASYVVKQTQDFDDRVWLDAEEDAVHTAEVLGVSIKSLERWLLKYVQSNDLQRISHGLYRKINNQIA